MKIFHKCHKCLQITQAHNRISTLESQTQITRHELSIQVQAGEPLICNQNHREGPTKYSVDNNNNKLSNELAWPH